jgi:hypothetical protein
MVEVALCAAATGGALLVGAALGCFRTPPKRLTAGMRSRSRRARWSSPSRSSWSSRRTDRPASLARPLRSSSALQRSSQPTF